MFLSYPCCNRLQVNPRPPLVAAAGTAVAAAAAAPATAGAAIATIIAIADTIAAAAAVSAAIAAASAVSASVAHAAIAMLTAAVAAAAAAAAAIAAPTTTAPAKAIIDSIASAADSTAAAAITAAIAAASAVSALVAHAAIAMISAATLTTTSRSAGSAAAAPQQPPFHHVGAPSMQPRLQRTFGHLLPTRSRLPTALPALTPLFHAYRADSNYVALVQERASGVVCNVQVRDLRSCSSDAPRLGLRACRLAIEWPQRPSPSVASTGIAGSTSACDLIEAGTAEYVACGQV